MNINDILNKLVPDSRLDKMVYIGRNYSLMDLKTDLKTYIIEYNEEIRQIEEQVCRLEKILVDKGIINSTKMKTVDELWEQAYKDFSDSIDRDIVNQIRREKC